MLTTNLSGGSKIILEPELVLYQQFEVLSQFEVPTSQITPFIQLLLYYGLFSSTTVERWEHHWARVINQ